MKNKRKIKILASIALGIMLLNIFVGAYTNKLPEKIVVTTEKNKIAEVKYGRYNISAKKINATGDENLVLYCLEIDKGYPAGNTFMLDKDAEKEISSIIAAGYPSKEPEELNVKNENEAYFATQIAIWSYLEGYDINAIAGKDINIVNAVRQIYNEGMSYSHPIMTINKVYISNNNSIQNLVAIFRPAQLG